MAVQSFRRQRRHALRHSALQLLRLEDRCVPAIFIHGPIIFNPGPQVLNSLGGRHMLVTPGASINQVLGSFSDSNPNATASSFTGLITWDDGHTSQATFNLTTGSPSGGGRDFIVTGSHTYAKAGSYEIDITIKDASGHNVLVVSTAAVPQPLKTLYAVGAGPGSEPWVKVYNATGTQIASFLAYSPAFRGGVNVAVGDVNGDGTPDIITGPGSGGGPQVEVFDGTKLTEIQANGTLPASAMLASFYAYAPSFTGGVNVAAGDVEDHGHADVITGAGPGGGPAVGIFSYVPGSPPAGPMHTVYSFYAYAATFHGGVSVAAGDLNGDSYADVITGAGSGGTPQIKAFSGVGLVAGGASYAAYEVANPLESFLAFAPTFTGGVSVAAADVNGDGNADIIAGAGAGASPSVKVFNGTSLAVLANFLAFAPSFTGGVRVSSVNTGSALAAEIVTAPSTGGELDINVFDPTGSKKLDMFNPFDSSFLGGMFVG